MSQGKFSPVNADMTVEGESPLSTNGNLLTSNNNTLSGYKLTIVPKLDELHELISIPGMSIERRNLALNLHSANPHQLQSRAAKTTAYQYSFLPQCIMLWNALPPKLHTCPSLSSFKHAL